MSMMLTTEQKNRVQSVMEITEKPKLLVVSVLLNY